MNFAKINRFRVVTTFSYFTDYNKSIRKKKCKFVCKTRLGVSLQKMKNCRLESIRLMRVRAPQCIVNRIVNEKTAVCLNTVSKRNDGSG